MRLKEKTGLGITRVSQGCVGKGEDLSSGRHFRCLKGGFWIEKGRDKLGFSSGIGSWIECSTTKTVGLLEQSDDGEIKALVLQLGRSSLHMHFQHDALALAGCW